MKRIVQFSFLFFAFLMFLPLMAGAQEEKTNTITITLSNLKPNAHNRDLSPEDLIEYGAEYPENSTAAQTTE